MDTSALDKAKLRIRTAKRARESMTDKMVMGEFEEHWFDFLAAWKSAYNKVEQATKDTAQGRQWFGAVKHERKNDPLLRYLFEARNDEEHGVVNSASAKPTKVLFQATKDASSMSLIMKDGQVVDVVGPDGESVANIVQQSPQESGLLPVKDRGGNVIPPPTSHLGEPMEPQPHIAADLGLRWIEALVATAEAMNMP